MHSLSDRIRFALLDLFDPMESCLEKRRKCRSSEESVPRRRRRHCSGPFRYSASHRTAREDEVTSSRGTQPCDETLVLRESCIPCFGLESRWTGMDISTGPHLPCRTSSATSLRPASLIFCRHLRHCYLLPTTRLSGHDAVLNRRRLDCAALAGQHTCCLTSVSFALLV